MTFHEKTYVSSRIGEFGEDSELKFLHTSDWHIGIQNKNMSRQKEFELFFDWLLATIEEKQVQYLLHAGDIFHHPHPSSRSQRLFFDFLLKLSSLPNFQGAIFIAGNHDSPSRIDAPSSLLRKNNIFVIGNFRNKEESLHQYIFPLTDEEGQVHAAVIALPYIQEARLGYRSIGVRLQEQRKLYAQAFETLYSNLAQLAKQKYPNAFLIGMGHLTCGEKKNIATEDTMTEIHSVGTLGALPTSTFHTDYDYVALGHIHRCYPLNEQHSIWYSGTPFPLRASEKGQHFVLLGELKDSVSIEKLTVPSWRTFHSLRDTPENLQKTLSELSWEETFPPFLDITLQVDKVMYGAFQLMLETLEKTFPEPEQRPYIIDFKQELTATDEESVSWSKSLSEVDPIEVFTELYFSKNKTRVIPQDILDGFDSLFQAHEARQRNESSEVEH